MFKRLVVAGLLFGLAATAPPAEARQHCALRDKVVDRLQSKFSETLAAGGLQGTQANTAMIEVWASEKTGTFTVILTSPQGVSCIVAAGTNFFTKDPELALSEIES